MNGDTLIVSVFQLSYGQFHFIIQRFPRTTLDGNLYIARSSNENPVDVRRSSAPLIQRDQTSNTPLDQTRNNPCNINGSTLRDKTCNTPYD